MAAQPSQELCWPWLNKRIRRQRCETFLGLRLCGRWLKDWDPLAQPRSVQSGALLCSLGHLAMRPSDYRKRRVAGKTCLCAKKNNVKQGIVPMISNVLSGLNVTSGRVVSNAHNRAGQQLWRPEEESRLELSAESHVLHNCLCIDLTEHVGWFHCRRHAGVSC